MRLGLLLIVAIMALRAGVSLERAREAYFQSATSKKAALAFEQMLDSVREDTLAALVCYKGAAEMLKAKNALSPFSKLGYFNRGKALIEAAIAKDSSALEPHFIRYTIQRHLPGFLGYNKNIYTDSILVDRGFANLTDQDLKNRITAYFNQAKSGIKN